MDAVRLAIAKQTEMQVTICNSVVERVHKQPELMDRFDQLSGKVDWIDRRNGSQDLLNLTRIALQTRSLDRTDEQIGLLYTVIEKLNVWDTLCPSSPPRDMKELCRSMEYERHHSKETIENDLKMGGRMKLEQNSGSVIYRQNDRGNLMYIVLEGSIVCKRSYHERGRVRHKDLPTIKPGQTFGELSLMGMAQRRETAVVGSYGASLLTISLDDYIKIITKGGTGSHMTVEKKFRLLSSSRLFQTMDAYKLFRLSLFFQPLEVPEGAILTKEGEPCKSLYVVRDGLLDLIVRRNQTKTKR